MSDPSSLFTRSRKNTQSDANVRSSGGTRRVRSRRGLGKRARDRTSRRRRRESFRAERPRTCSSACVARCDDNRAGPVRSRHASSSHKGCEKRHAGTRERVLSRFWVRCVSIQRECTNCLNCLLIRGSSPKRASRFRDGRWMNVDFSVALILDRASLFTLTMAASSACFSMASRTCAPAARSARRLLGRRVARRPRLAEGAVPEGSKVPVVGATGVGQLAVAKLLEAVPRVRAAGRSAERARDVRRRVAERLRRPTRDRLRGPAGRRRSARVEHLPRRGRDRVAASIPRRSAGAVAGRERPEPTDYVSVRNLVDCVKRQSGNVRAVVLVSSVGVDRQDQMPFLVLDLFGVLRHKSGEDAVIASGTPFTILRPGRSLTVHELRHKHAREATSGERRAVEMAKGDRWPEETSRTSSPTPSSRRCGFPRMTCAARTA